MKKIFLFLFVVLSVFIYIKNPKAEEIDICNKLDVCLKQEEYEAINNLFGNEFFEIMTQEDANNLIKDNVVHGTIQTVQNVSLQPFSAIHETGSKILKASSACSSTRCTISTVLTWKKIPTYKSYDVVGAYLDGVTYKGNLITRVYSPENTTYYPEVFSQKSGFGVSVKLPQNPSSIIIYQYYDVSTNGKIYISYQHARKNLSLEESKKYNISLSGYGNVFLFDSSVRSYYDAMSGVSISV